MLSLLFDHQLAVLFKSQIAHSSMYHPVSGINFLIYSTSLVIINLLRFHLISHVTVYLLHCHSFAVPIQTERIFSTNLSRHRLLTSYRSNWFHTLYDSFRILCSNVSTCILILCVVADISHSMRSLEWIVAILPWYLSVCQSVCLSGTGVHCDHTGTLARI